jgi:hypothetical protein
MQLLKLKRFLALVSNGHGKTTISNKERETRAWTTLYPWWWGSRRAGLRVWVGEEEADAFLSLDGGGSSKKREGGWGEGVG